MTFLDRFDRLLKELVKRNPPKTARQMEEERQVREAKK
jgi:hypothetical protein